ncbi:hypothetical protein HWI79_886 [Cryptosporidium felis]|nr:hypothetical protein HWI79_886 [Cryptosporidium felis]
MANEEFICRDLGTWVTENQGYSSEDLQDEKRESDPSPRSPGLHPICYFSPLTVLSDLVQNLQICSGAFFGEPSCSGTGCQGDPSQNDLNFECTVTPQKSIIEKIFHKKVVQQLGLGDKTPMSGPGNVSQARPNPYSGSYCSGRGLHWASSDSGEMLYAFRQMRFRTGECTHGQFSREFVRQGLPERRGRHDHPPFGLELWRGLRRG